MTTDNAREWLARRARREGRDAFRDHMACPYTSPDLAGAWWAGYEDAEEEFWRRHDEANEAAEWEYRRQLDDDGDPEDEYRRAP